MSLFRPSEESLNDLCLRAVARSLRSQAGPMAIGSPKISSADLHAMRLHWALSGSVGRLAQRIMRHPRELAGSHDTKVAISSGTIDGTVDARATIALQDASGDATLFVVHENGSTMFSGPNHIVAWTLHEALRLILWAIKSRSGTKPPEWLSARALLIESALRTHAVREILLSPSGRARPGSFALRSAAKSRAPVYRVACEAFRSLEDVEAGNADALREMFSDTLVSSMESWRKFELATALSIADAIGAAIGQPVVMDLALSPSKPLATAGPFSVIWQQGIKPRPDHALDITEKMTKDLAMSLGVSQSSSRADVAVLMEGAKDPLAMIECKWFESEDSRQPAIFEACSQLSRYARDAHPADPAKARSMLSSCIVALAWRGSAPLVADGSGLVGCVDFNDMADGVLKTWAGTLAAPLAKAA